MVGHGAKEMIEQQLMTARSSIHKLDLEAILAQVVPEFLAQPVREIDNKLSPVSPTVVGVFEQR
jgi:hypothetical protein